MRVLVLGGARSGKSAEAERRLADQETVTYVATADRIVDDAEWTARIRDHVARRPPGWRTVETRDLAALLRDTGPDDPPLLIDCLTLWCSAEPSIAEVDELVVAWQQTKAYAVAVSNEVGSGVVPPTPGGRAFRDRLGTLNMRIAAASDEVWLMTAGLPLRLR